MDSNVSEEHGAVLVTLQRLAEKVDRIDRVLSQRHKDAYRVEEFATLVGRSPYTVRRWIAEGRIQAKRITGTGDRGRLLIARSEFERLLADGLGDIGDDLAKGREDGDD